MRTLTQRLVVTAVALVALVSVLIALATTLAMRSYLDHQLDDDVRASLGRAYGAPPPRFDDDQDDSRGRGDDGPGRLGQAVGTVSATIDGTAGSGILLTQGGDDGYSAAVALDRDVIAALAAVPVDGAPHDVELPGLGSYRVIAEDRGVTAVAGLPASDVHDLLESLVRWEALLTLLGIGAAAIGGTIVVRRQLAPLREVAATAHRVAEKPLSEGEIDLSDRVPERLTDERNEVGQVGAALNSLLDHVEASLAVRHRSEQQVRQFVADASHELRTPLATIAGYTELARHRPDAQATALAKVEGEAARMTGLVEDLLLLARLDAGRPLVREPVDLSLLLMEAVNDARVVAPDHTWRLSLPDEPVEVVGDEQRLHQVVTNLLTNARKYTPAGTTVTVTARPDGFDVHDDGPGFAPGIVEHAFERFVRGDAARHREGGAGLGLALVRAITGAHGGTVALDSRPGSTTVAVTLPPRS
ncbi:sensor histidine kinase [Nocardioides sp. Soil805]|uniref:sensor histidine kinase n=1 Tax=Nocardioides sp. Soil805 TaxID=1736416 RepID=UPI000B117478|nr:HAMP domain-containing sensor histidine kinase [Nocardioides sp. Soil805]